MHRTGKQIRAFGRLTAHPSVQKSLPAIKCRRFGLPVRLIDKEERPAQWSQALVVQARTLEQFDRYGITEQGVAQGRKISKAQIWSNAKQIASRDFVRIPSRFRYLLFLPRTKLKSC
jgi:2-polyprenyl-6-methoxyphenol hydroxylase-like FAD-dependent oxidoreductase